MKVVKEEVRNVMDAPITEADSKDSMMVNIAVEEETVGNAK